MEVLSHLESLILWPYACLIIAGGYFLRMFAWPKKWPMKFIVLGWAVVAGVLYYFFDKPTSGVAFLVTYFLSTSAYELLIKEVEKCIASKTSKA